MLQKCQKIKITLSLKKFKMAREVAFVGYVVKEGEVRADPERAMALTNFPKPT